MFLDEFSEVLVECDLLADRAIVSATHIGCVFRNGGIVWSALAGFLQFIPDSTLHSFERAGNRGERIFLRSEYLNFIAVVFVERSPFCFFSYAHNTAIVQISKTIRLGTIHKLSESLWLGQK